MKALIQRVRSASVDIAGERHGEIGQGILVLLGIEKTDSEASADKLLRKILGYRIFADSEGKMNLIGHTDPKWLTLAVVALLPLVEPVGWHKTAAFLE